MHVFANNKPQTLAKRHSHRCNFAQLLSPCTDDFKFAAGAKVRRRAAARLPGMSRDIDFYDGGMERGQSSPWKLPGA